MHRIGGGGVHTKYFWVTQYWLLLVALVQLSQLFSIFTTSPTSPNHSQSRVCKYLTLIELSILVTAPSVRRVLSVIRSVDTNN